MELTFYIWENDTEAGPYTLDQMRSIWSTGRITLNSIVRQDTDGEWKTARDFEIIYAPPENGSENKVIQRVVVADFDMPFSNMVIFIVKWAIAAIPAAIVIFCGYFLIITILQVLLGPVFRL
jgi:GYF domain 2